MSTSENINDEVCITDGTEINAENKSDTNINNENSLTESIIMSKASAESTPTVSRVEKVSIDDLFHFMKANFNE